MKTFEVDLEMSIPEFVELFQLWDSAYWRVFLAGFNNDLSNLVPAHLAGVVFVSAKNTENGIAAPSHWVEDTIYRIRYWTGSGTLWLVSFDKDTKTVTVNTDKIDNLLGLFAWNRGFQNLFKTRYPALYQIFENR